MKNRFQLTTRLFLLFSFGLALFLVSGCDTTDPGGDTVILRTEIKNDSDGDPIRFSFSSDNITAGRLEDVGCNCTLDIGSFLQGQGFTKTEIFSATVESARLVLLFPLNEQFNFLNEVILKLEASGLSATEVANLQSSPSVREVALNVLPNRNISGFLQRATFAPILQVNANLLNPNEDYEVALVLNLRIEMEGL